MEEKENLERNDTARSLPRWFLQGREQVELHFRDTIGDRLEEPLSIDSVDLFECSGCFHYVEKDCEGKGYKGKEVFECLCSRDWRSLEWLKVVTLLHFPFEEYTCEACVDYEAGSCEGKGHTTMEECVGCMKEKIASFTIC
jgi:hypothetical protein